MIHYQLHCAGAHEFDGWFKDSDAFERQAKRGLISCPVCSGTKVERALMAPGIPRKGRVKPVETMPVPEPAKPAAGGVIPDAVRAALGKLRAEVEKSCDYVGNDFAEEARRIHHGEAPPRGIYGESSDEEAEALADEGIDIARIPWVPRTDS
ncbi:hypothetical protein GCM10010909_20310 [Acidocella aquatica]|uniref:DUF1178 family protein n=1 Tax=Acidocella aquatica TaxID=1922313 RepID=A0ABQ6A7T1_9PROT|nr:DUF1178 family protein [Acidocella aquatica]GLR67350.1 hypothetical protein GCM10010909_20310 [Acidocella aquatica]